MRKLLAVLALLGLFTLSACEKDKNENSNSTTSSGDASATLVVQSSADDIATYTIPIQEEKTAFDLLTELANKGDLTVDYSEGDFGVMIESIDGLKANNDTGNYWLWYVNDQAGTTAADQYVVQSGDEIRFEYGSGF